MKIGKPTGNQVAFFILATWLLAVPMTYAIERAIGAGPELREWLERTFHLLVVGLALLVVPPLRRASWQALSGRIPEGSRTEVTVVAVLSPIVAFGFAGAYALWWATFDDPIGLERRISALGTAEHVLSVALRPETIATQLFIAVMIGPVVEEIVFRAFLFRAWADRHGWVIAMFLSSAIFGLLHTYFVAAFLASVVNTCVYRRTGSLRAAIVVHSIHNLLVFYPLLGQFILPLDLQYPGELSSWSWHLLALAVITAGLPGYIWMSRDDKENASEPELDHVALPR